MERYKMVMDGTIKEDCIMKDVVLHDDVAEDTKKKISIGCYVLIMLSFTVPLLIV